MERTKAGSRKAHRAEEDEAVKPGAVDHPKTLDFARRLKAHDAPRSWQGQAVGHLASLWAWAWRVTDNGNLSSFEPFDIAAGGKWRGNPDDFIALLIEAKFLDRKGQELWLHDAIDHVPGYVKDRLYQREKKARSADRSADHSSTLRASDRTALASASASASDLDQDPSDDTARGPKGGSEGKGRKPRAPITEQQGIAGDLARMWAAVYERAPEWGSGIAAINELAQSHSEDEIRAAFGRYLKGGDSFTCDAAHPPRLFKSQYDRWAVEKKLPGAAPVRGEYQSSARFDAVDYGEGDICEKCDGFRGHEPGCLASETSQFEIREGCSRDMPA